MDVAPSPRRQAAIHGARNFYRTQHGDTSTAKTFCPCGVCPTERRHRQSTKQKQTAVRIKRFTTPQHEPHATHDANTSTTMYRNHTTTPPFACPYPGHCCRHAEPLNLTRERAGCRRRLPFLFDSHRRVRFEHCQRHPRQIITSLAACSTHNADKTAAQARDTRHRQRLLLQQGIRPQQDPYAFVRL